MREQVQGKKKRERMSLHTKEYNTMEQKDTNKPQDKEGIEDLINRFKFS